MPVAESDIRRPVVKPWQSFDRSKDTLVIPFLIENPDLHNEYWFRAKRSSKVVSLLPKKGLVKRGSKVKNNKIKNNLVFVKYWGKKHSFKSIFDLKR